MSNTALKTVFQDFAEVAAPYLHITDAAHYEEALALVEALMEDANDNDDDPIDGVIGLVAHAVNRYECGLAELEFLKRRPVVSRRTSPCYAYSRSNMDWGSLIFRRLAINLCCRVFYRARET